MGQSSPILKRTMRFHLLVLSALVAVGLANEDVFLKWAKEQGKQYKTKAELTMRQAIFMKNYNRMVEHNKDFDAGKATWARGVNQWYDLTMEEWRAEMGIGMSGNMEEQNTTRSTPHPKPTGAAPSSWDWRSHGIVSPVKNQKHCGSCAAFTTVAIVESCFAQQTGVITDLSEEHLVNCMATNGCSGWYTNQYLDDLVSSNGGRLEQEYCCSYTATDGHSAMTTRVTTPAPPSPATTSPGTPRKPKWRPMLLQLDLLAPRSLLTTCSTTATASSRTLAAARRRLTPTAGRSTIMQLQPSATALKAVETSGSSRTAGAQAGERVASSGSRGALGIADLASITMLHRTAPWVNKISFSQK